MGSVKEVVMKRSPTEGESGEGYFLFSDAFSVFDWGRVGELPGKGEALAAIAAKFHELAAEEGVPTCYLGLLDSPSGTPLPLSRLRSPTRLIAVRIYRRVLPRNEGGVYDYSPLRGLKSNYLVPLEVIYRNEVGENSSLARRLREGGWSPSDFGVSELPLNTPLPSPIIDFSTKFEERDRYLKEGEARE